MARVYFHVDLNAFFASAEVLLNPSLAGKPMAVAGHTRRSVVSTASYEARKYGVSSGMSIQEAIRLCPDLIIQEGHYHYYEELSSQFIAIVSLYSARVEQASIDECYVDMTETIRRYERPLDLAWELQQRIRRETGLQCSIGIGPNLFLAKMASDMKKPMGITVLRIRDVPSIMWPLPIKDMRGIGKKTLPYMEELNIRTIGDLANYPDLTRLKPVFGKNTEEILERARGIDHSEMLMEYEARSMGISETLLEDVTDYDEIKGVFRSLARTLSQRLKTANRAGTKVSIRICYYDLHNADRSRSLREPVFRSDDLFVQAMQLFDENWEEGDAVRLLGITVSDFVEDSFVLRQLSLFDEQQERRAETGEVIADLNHSLGAKAFVRASALMEKRK